MRSDSGDRSTRAWLLPCIGIAAAIQVAVVNYWPAFPSPNERPRAYQALALVTRGTLAIDAEVERFGGMEDVAASRGRLYPNKAPGTLPLMVPAALAARVVAGGSPERELAITLVLGRLLASSLPFLLTVLLLARHVAADTDPRGAAVVVAFALGSPALIGSLLVFSHSLTALLLFTAFALLYSARRPGGWAAAAAGAAIGWAVTAEYPAIVPGAVLVAPALPRLRLAGLSALVLGGAVPALALAAYNLACFGSPLALSSGREAHAAYVSLASRGLFGVGAPSLPALAGLLASPSRGILVWWPLGALALLGARRGFSGRGDAAPLVLVPLSLLVAMAGYPNWHGGWFPGPRYLLAALPFAALLAARGAARLASAPAGRVLVCVAALWGIALAWLSLAAFPFPPEDFPLPSFTFSLPLLRYGVSVPSWLPPSLLAGLALVLAAGAAAIVCRTACADRRETAAALIAAALMLGAAAALPPPAAWKPRLEAAVVRDVYVGAPGGGALEALEPACETVEQQAQLRRWLAERDTRRTGPLR